MYNARKNNKSLEIIANLEKNLQNWVSLWTKARRNSTFFYRASSLVNIDILTFQYILDQKDKAESYEAFKTSILSLTPTVEPGARFYPNLSENHFYADGYNYEYYDQYNIRDNISQNSSGLKYIESNKKLEAGLDAGNMFSMVLGQEQDNGNTYRVLKNIYTLTPEWTRELANKFISFFEPHKYKMLELYYDRSANNYSKAKKDIATLLKHDIEYDITGKRTGWYVNLMSIGQGNIFQDDEYNLMLALMSNKYTDLPKLMIDKFECKELKSSLEKARAKMETDKRGRKQMRKIKTSEKKKLIELPMLSTNMSDGFKYLMYRKKWVNIMKRKLTS